MTIGIVSAFAHQPSRLRLVFNTQPSVGGFDPVWFTVTTVDSLGPDSPVLAALGVAGLPDQVELVLKYALAAGARYHINVATGFPTADGNTLSDLGFDFLTSKLAQPAAITETPSDSLYARLFGSDIQWNGDDWVEDATGDLQAIAGVTNVTTALERRMLSEGLLWDSAYGVKPRRYVDAPVSRAAQLASDCTQQALADDRVQQATSSVEPSQNNGAEQINLQLVLTGGVSANVTTQAPSASA